MPGMQYGSMIAVLAPRGRDAAVASHLLQANGMETVIAPDLAMLDSLLEQHVGAVLIAEEAIGDDGASRIQKALEGQPVWSDVPFIVLTNGTTAARSQRERQRIDALGNVLLLSRPLHQDDLIRAAKSVLKARARQFEARARMQELQVQGEKLRESEARSEAIVHSIDQMIWSTLPDGYHDFYNDRWYEFTGVPSGSTDGEGWNDMFHPEDQERAWARWRHSLQTGEPYEIEYRLRHRSGDYRWVLGKAHPVRNAAGTIVRWYGTCTDVHDNVRIREELASSRELLEQAVEERTRELQSLVAERERAWDLSVDLLGVASADGLLTNVNEAWHRVLGWDLAELLNRPFAAFTHPDDREQTLAKFAGIIDEPLTKPYEYRLRHKDGSYRTFAWTAFAENGLIYAAGRDVTDHNERAKALSIAEDALRQSQKLETIGQLTGGVAHDFNNLLMAVRSSLELLQKRLPQDDERAMSYWRNAMKGTERGASLTQRMLAFARKQELNAERVDVGRLLPGIRDLIERSIGPQIALDLAVAPGMADALVDANQLEMALLNLALNARDAMEGVGSVKIAVDCRAIEDASDLEPGSYVRIAMTDTGPGMEEETLAQAMDPFFTTKGVGKGTGLGLSMVHGLARQSGGTFRLASRLGEGTEAELYLPVAHGSREQRTAAEPASVPAADMRKLTILAVDDDALVLFGTVALLEELGHEVRECHSGAEALNLLPELERIDLVITDQAMPNMTGVELARTIHKTRPYLPVILATGYSEMPDGAKNDIAVRLEKPFGDRNLQDAIAKAVNGQSFDETASANRAKVA